MIDTYADLMLTGVQELVHLDCDDYVLEVRFVRSLATWLTARGWTSTHRKKDILYPGTTNAYADMLTTHADACLRITNETKQYVLDYPTRADQHLLPNNSLSHQHLGIHPGKDNNAVHDIEKLKLALGTHVSFLLIRFARVDRPGEEFVERFREKSRIDSALWTECCRDWAHPADSRHHVWCHLWCRPIDSFGAAGAG